MMLSSALWVAAVVAGALAARAAADPGTPGQFLAPRRTVNDTLSFDANQSASGEEALQAEAAVTGDCCSRCPGSPFCSPYSGTCYASKEKVYYKTCSAQTSSCCSGCPGSAFCSPVSGQCHEQKSKDYYKTCAAQPSSCCSNCPGSAFCSPVSGQCHEQKNKDYYKTCSAQPSSCCSGCSGSAFCSPVSGQCYEQKKKDYYKTCSAKPSSCCSGCSGSSFCSPVSGQCYDQKYKDYYKTCSAPPPHGDNVLTLYHQTSPEIAAKIFQEGFRSGRSGWCGGGIYFATTPGATDHKAIGPDSHKGFIIEAKVDVGRVKHASKRCSGVNAAMLQSQHYDSVTFNPGDGDEYMIYSKHRVLSMKQWQSR